MTNLNTPWSLHFDRDGTEDIAVICDADGNDLVTSRHFWRPEGDDPIPPTLAAMNAMGAAPKLLRSLKGLVDVIGQRPVTDLNLPLFDALDQANAAIGEAEGE